MSPQIISTGLCFRKESTWQCRKRKKHTFDPWVRKIGGGLGNGNQLQYFCLEITMDREAWKHKVRGVVEGQTRPQGRMPLLPYVAALSTVCLRKHKEGACTTPFSKQRLRFSFASNRTHSIGSNDIRKEDLHWSSTQKDQ